MNLYSQRLFEITAVPHETQKHLLNDNFIFSIRYEFPKKSNVFSSAICACESPKQSAKKPVTYMGVKNFTHITAKSGIETKSPIEVSTYKIKTAAVRISVFFSILCTVWYMYKLLTCFIRTIILPNHPL